LDWKLLSEYVPQTALTALLLTVFTIYLRSRLDRKLESLKQELLEKTHARSALFEKEMEFYEELSAALSTIENGCKYLRSQFGLGNSEETRIEKEKRELLPVKTAYNNIIRLSGRKQLFYPEELHNRLEDFLRLVYGQICRHELMISDMVIKGWTNPDSDSWKRLVDGAEEILSHVEQMRTIVRRRIEHYRGGGGDSFIS